VKGNGNALQSKYQCFFAIVIYEEILNKKFFDEAVISADRNAILKRIFGTDGIIDADDSNLKLKNHQLWLDLHTVSGEREHDNEVS
jgi:hypothetical protein